jgi:hypothetical protein
MRGSTGAIVGIRFACHQAQRGEAACHVAHIAHLNCRECAAKQRLLAIGQEFLQHLIATDREIPNRLGDIAPIGVLVEEHVVGASAEQGGFRLGGRLGGRVVAGYDASAARHHRAALAGVAPAGGEHSIGLGHGTTAALGRGGDGRVCGIECAGGDSGNRRIGIEQCGDAGAERGGGAQQIGVVRERHTGPVLADAIGVLG